MASSYLVDAQGGLPTLVEDGSKAYLHADGLLGEIGGGTRYALSDALGSVRGLTDDAGSLVGTASYEAFGATRTSSGASSLFGFTGEPTDATGLVYLRARTLDPATGRFLSADSVIPNAPGTSGYNLYAYAGNDPTTWTDPTGHLADLASVDEAMLEALGSFVQLLSAAGFTTITVALILELAAAYVAPALALAVQVAFWIAVVAVVLFIVMLVVSGMVDEPGRGDTEEWTADELEQAQNSPVPPPPPVPPGGSTASCDAAPQDGVVYRALRPDEQPSAGLTAKNPSATYTPEGHILNGSRPGFASQFISATWDEAVARTVFGGPGSRIARIDLGQVEGRIINLDDQACRESVLRGTTARNFARAHREVLIEGFVPPSAITLLS